MLIRSAGHILSLSLLLAMAPVDSDLSAQSVVVGLKGGISIPNIEGGGTPQSEGYTSRLAPTLGAFISYDLNSRFALQGEVSFSGQGGNRNGMQPIFADNLTGLPVPPDVTLYAGFDNETILNYLEIPVLACYSFTGNTSPVDVFVDAGPYLGILLNAKVVTSGTSNIYLDSAGTMPLEIGGHPLPPQNFDNESDIADDLNSINVGITGGVGMNVNSAGGKLRFDLRGAYGFIPLQADEKNGSNHTGAFYMTIGYGFRV